MRHINERALALIRPCVRIASNRLEWPHEITAFACGEVCHTKTQCSRPSSADWRRGDSLRTQKLFELVEKRELCGMDLRARDCK